MDNTLTKIDQIAFVVNDMEKAKAVMKTLFGAEPDRENQASTTRHRMAFYHFANIELELILPDERTDTQKKFLEKHGQGIHHIRFDVSDYKKTTQDLASRGYPLLSETDSVRKEGVKVAFINTEPDLGAYIELINMQEALDKEENKR